MRFVDPWRGDSPPLDVPLEIAERRGCDRFPLDPGKEDDRVTLLAYVWPDQLERFELLRAALGVAAEIPVPVDEGDAVAWLDEQLASLPAGIATVVFHSYFRQYLEPSDSERMQRTLEDAAGRASADAPLAWLSLEETRGDYANSELRLRLWPGGEERLLARCHVHPREADWLA